MPSYFPGGKSDSIYENIFYQNTRGTSGAPKGGSFYYCAPNTYNDGVNFNNCYAYCTYGYAIGKGGSIFWNGGRVVGVYSSTGDTAARGYGVLLSGGNGSCWLNNIDFISHYRGIWTVQDSAAGSNREVFLDAACVDSCFIGLHVTDSCYLSWTDVWAASCDSSCIDVSFTGDGVITLTGGTIFNAGAIGLISTTARAMSINQYGRVDIDGVTVRNNVRGIEVLNSARTLPVNIQGGTFYANATTDVLFNSYTNVYDNIFEDPKVIGDSSNTNGSWRIRGNKGINGKWAQPVAGIAAPAWSGTSYVNNTGFDLEIYLREGSVTSVSCDGNPVLVYTANTPVTGLSVTVPAGATLAYVGATAPAMAVLWL